MKPLNEQEHQNSSDVLAVIFDLDGVIVSTDEYHYRGWKKLADEEGIYFDRRINENLRGISRMESLEIVLKRANRTYSLPEKEALAERKNRYYQQMIAELTPQNILPGAMDFLEGLRARHIRLAVASSSKNAPFILERVGLSDYFDAVVSGKDIKRSKPDPEVFLLAAKRLGVVNSRCVVVEDAFAGIEAAARGGMKSFGIGFASGCDKADLTAPDLSRMTAAEFLDKMQEKTAEGRRIH